MQWKICPRYPNYAVSENGDIRRIKADDRRAVIDKVLTGAISKTGYLSYCLRDKGVSRWESAHVLVAEAFIGSRPSLYSQMRHLDGNNRNNYYGNLKWGTAYDN